MRTSVTNASAGPFRITNPIPAHEGTKKAHPTPDGAKWALRRKTGGDLLSQGVAPQVPSALRCLTALFGMGRGVSTALLHHRNLAKPSPVELQNRTTTSRKKYPSSPRPISTGQLLVSPPFHRRPINLVVYQGSYSLKGMGELISRTASRLDAFSGYPCHT